MPPPRRRRPLPEDQSLPAGSAATCPCVHSNSIVQHSFLDRFDLEREELRVVAALMEIAAHEPQPRMAGAAPHRAKLSLLVEAPNRRAPVRDAVTEKGSGALAHVLEARREHDDVGGDGRAVGEHDAVSCEPVDLDPLLDLDLT